MGFLAPLFLGGLLAVGLPIYLHLLQRHKTTPLPFSSLMFFEHRTQSSVKHRRLRYLLLFALRLALVILLVLAFANPYFNRAVTAGGGEKLILYVLDNSFSMRAGSRFEDARREAISVLASRRPVDKGQVMALGSQMEIFTAQPLQDTNALRAAIQSVQQGDSRSNYGELARTARSLAESIKTPIEIHLFTDVQKTAMPPVFSEMTLPETARLEIHSVSKKAEPNWALETVNAPSLVWDTKKAKVQATVAGFGTPKATKTVSLVIAGKVAATKTAEVGPSGRATVEFVGLEVPYGYTKCEIKIDSADSLAADDRYLFAVQRSDPQHVLFVREARDTESALFFGTALASAAENAFALDQMTVDQTGGVNPAKFAFVVLSDVVSLPETFETELTRYVKAGGSVLVASGANTSRRPRVPIFDSAQREPVYFSRSGDRYAGVGDVDPSHPSLNKADRWGGVKFYLAADVDASGARVAAKLTDQTPVLLDKKIGEGRVLLFASGFEGLTNDFPRSPMFVPFVEQTARYLSGLERRGGSRPVDSFLDLRSSKEQSTSVEIIDPAGKRPLSLKEATTAQSFQLTREGYYELNRGSGRNEMAAVNADRRESDLSLLDEDVQALWSSKTASAGPSGTATGTQESKPYSIWWYVLFIGLLAAVAESLLASRYLSIEREAP
jgi:hypothetical protein